MQRTGYRDIKGNPIYEGDYVRLKCPAMAAEIVYHGNGFCFRWLHPRTIELRGAEIEPIFDNIKYFEVVGNCFETPHLPEEVLQEACKETLKTQRQGVAS